MSKLITGVMMYDEIMDLLEHRGHEATPDESLKDKLAGFTYTEDDDGELVAHLVYEDQERVLTAEFDAERNVPMYLARFDSIESAVEFANQQFLVLDGREHAFMGLTRSVLDGKPRYAAAYSEDLILNGIMKEASCSLEEAVENFEHNIRCLEKMELGPVFLETGL